MKKAYKTNVLSLFLSILPTFDLHCFLPISVSLSEFDPLTEFKQSIVSILFTIAFSIEYWSKSSKLRAIDIVYRTR